VNKGSVVLYRDETLVVEPGKVKELGDLKVKVP
jgi:hypothetical protein